MLTLTRLLFFTLLGLSRPQGGSEGSESALRLMALVKNSSPVMNIFEKYTEFFVVINDTRHAIDREEIHRYGIAFEITRLFQK